MKKSLLALLTKETKHEWKHAVHLICTFIGATLVGRSVWQWIVDASNTLVAFFAGIVILFAVVIWQHHFLKHRGR